MPWTAVAVSARHKPLSATTHETAVVTGTAEFPPEDPQSCLEEAAGAQESWRHRLGLSYARLKQVIAATHACCCTACVASVQPIDQLSCLEGAAGAQGLWRNSSYGSLTPDSSLASTQHMPAAAAAAARHVWPHYTRTPEILPRGSCRGTGVMAMSTIASSKEAVPRKASTMPSSPTSHTANC